MEVDSNKEIVNNIIEKITDNKYLVIGLIVLVSLYSSEYVNYISINFIDFFDNPIVKFVIFALISALSFVSPAIAIILTIAILVTFQVISSIKIKREIDIELNVEKFNTNYGSNEISGFNPRDSGYYSNPILKLDQLSPTTSNLNLNFETPDQIYNNMIKNGRQLLDDSYQMNKDLKKRWDSREKKIANATELEGQVNVQSGINRLQKANLGEYNMPIYSDKNVKKYIKFDSNSSYDKYKVFANNPEIMSSLQKMKNYYEQLQDKSLTPEEFNNILIDYYEAKLNLLETIFKYKKDSMSKEKVDKAESALKEVGQSKKLGSKWLNSLDTITEILF